MAKIKPTTSLLRPFCLSIIKFQIKAGTHAKAEYKATPTINACISSVVAVVNKEVSTKYLKKVISWTEKITIEAIIKIFLFMITKKPHRGDFFN